MDTPDDVPMKLLVDLESGTALMVALTDEELALRERDQAAALVAEQAASALDATREALVSKLKTGKATSEETQSALATLL